MWGVEGGVWKWGVYTTVQQDLAKFREQEVLIPKVLLEGRDGVLLTGQEILHWLTSIHILLCITLHIKITNSLINIF